MNNRGVNQETNQTYNRCLILRTLQHLKQCTRVELGKKTGLKQATISNIINSFIEKRLVEETGSLSGAKGRRAIGIRLASAKIRVIGLRITRQYYAIGVFTLNCDEVGERVYEEIRDVAPESVIDAACEKINSIIDENPSLSFWAVGVAVPGPYYKDSGVIAMSQAAPGWVNVRIVERMRAHIRIPIIVDHDANAGAMAESILVPGRDMYNSMVYVSAGQGIGAGIINNGEIYGGSFGVAGEIGHTSIDINGIPCYCGRRGCLTQYASTIALRRNIMNRLGKRAISFSEVVERLRRGDAAVQEEFNVLMKYLGVGVANLLYAYNPSCIVLGDELSAIGLPLLEALKQNLAEIGASRMTEDVKIELAQLGFDSAYIGAAVIASRYIFEHIGAYISNEPRQ